MGSLMSGWSSSVLSDKEGNRSLTKEEVAAFWRQQHGKAPENGEAAAGLPPPLVAGSPRAEMVPLAARRMEETRSMPPLAVAGRVHGGGTRSGLTTCCSPSYGYGGQQLSFPFRSEPPSPATTTRGEGFFLPENESSGTTRGWWTQSSWAFLNEPPAQSFPCDQFHAARIVTGNA